MRRLIVVFGCVMWVLFSSLAFGAQGPYGRVDIGLAMASDSDATEPGAAVEIEHDVGIAFGGALGYGFGNMRVEGELGYQKNDYDKVGALGLSIDASGDASILSLLFNGYYDFTNNTAFTPFVSAGIGFATYDVNDLNVVGLGLSAVSDDDTVFAYQLGVGLGYAVSETVTIDGYYRYLGMSDPEFGTAELEFGSHNLFVGLRFNF